MTQSMRNARNGRFSAIFAIVSLALLLIVADGHAKRHYQTTQIDKRRLIEDFQDLEGYSTSAGVFIDAIPITRSAAPTMTDEAGIVVDAIPITRNVEDAARGFRRQPSAAVEELQSYGSRTRANRHHRPAKHNNKFHSGKLFFLQ